MSNLSKCLLSVLALTSLLPVAGCEGIDLPTDDGTPGAAPEDIEQVQAAVTSTGPSGQADEGAGGRTALPEIVTNRGILAL